MGVSLESETGVIVDRGEKAPGKATCARVPLIFNFHFQLACLSGILLLVDVVGCRLTHIVVPNLGGIAIALVLVVAGIQAIPIYWHSKGRTELRDAALTLPWFALFVVLLPYPMDVMTKLGSPLPLEDASFARIDTWLGVSVPAIVHWAAGNMIGHWITSSYTLLVPLLYLSLFLPALTGKVERARQFILAHFLFILSGLPFILLLPAVGPWFGFHTVAPYPAQIQTQADLFSLRQSGQFGPYLHHFCGVVCFPSGHVVGAIVSGYTLFIYRYIRIPVVVLSAAIILSTMTSGWHYFFDVLGGVAMATLIILFVRWLSTKWQSGVPEHAV